MNHTMCPECGMLSVFGSQPHTTGCSKPEPVPDISEDVKKVGEGNTPASHAALVRFVMTQTQKITTHDVVIRAMDHALEAYDRYLEQEGL